MRKLFKAMTIAVCAWMAGSVSAQQLSFEGDKHSFAAGEQVTINYDGAEKGGKILLYHNLSMMPLSETGTVRGKNGTYHVAVSLQPGNYRAVLLSPKGEEKAEAAFKVDYSPLPQGGKRIFLLSDPHVMSPDLVQAPDNATYLYVINHDRKLLPYSYEIFMACLDSIRALKPDLLLIPGDLTKDGELLSHQLVASCLQQLLDEGIPTVMIPGNHDMENGAAKVYTAAGQKNTDIVTVDEFATIYENFGWKDAYDRDPNSLTYAIEPIEGLCFICIDDCRLKSRGDTGKDDGEYGRVSDATLEWVLDQADRAKENGKVVIVTIHHQLLQHYNGQEQIMESAATENGESIARQLADHGVRLVLTGHMHMPSVSTIPGYETDERITEVSSASPVCYPSQYRILTLAEDLSTVDVQTRYITRTESLDDVHAMAHQQIENSLSKSIAQLVPRYMSTFNSMLEMFANEPAFAKVIADVPTDPDSLTLIADECFGQTVSKVFFTLAEGNEHLKNASEIILNQLKTDCDHACEMIFDNQNEATRIFLSSSMYIYLLENAEDVLKSMMSDTSYLGTAYADQTDDLYLTVELKKTTGIEERVAPERVGDKAVYTVDGHFMGHDTSRLPKGVYVIRQGAGNSKVIVR